jgi:hypothetical protein
MGIVIRALVYLVTTLRQDSYFEIKNEGNIDNETIDAFG